MRQLLPTTVFSLGTLALIGLALTGCRERIALGEAPPQPIAFKHRVHIDEGLECTRCHTGAAEGKHAGLPAMQVCVRCHEHAIPDHPEVAKLLEAYDAAEPIVWRKINVIPDRSMVHFNHAAHARAEIVCQECHGQVADMDLAVPVLDVADMGWCVECHREHGASDDCLTCHY